MKIIKRVFITFTVLLFTVLLLLGCLVYLIYDNSYKSYEYRDYNNDLNYEINDALSCSIKNAEDNALIDLSLSEDKLNCFLKALINTLNTAFDDKMKIMGADIKISDDANTKISIYFKVLGFPSSIKGTFTLKENEEIILFKINNANIGKLEASKNLISLVARNIIKSKEIEDALLEKGIKLNIDINELKIEINKKEIPEMVYTVLKDDPNKDLYKTLVDLIFENDLIKLIASSHELGFDANLSKLAYNNITFYDIPYNFNYDDVKLKTESLLNNHIITYDKCGLVFDYLVRGYKNISEKDEENKYDFIKSLDLSSIGILNNTAYKGILEVPIRPMDEILISQAPSIIDFFSPSFDFKIYEEDLDTILFNSGVVGISYAFPRLDGSEYKISYLYLEALYAHISNDSLELVIVLNINGYRIAIKTSSVAYGSDGLKIITRVNSINMGIISLKDEEIKIILSYLNTTLIDEDWISFNKENSEICFNFTKIFTENTTLNLLAERASNTNVSLIENGNKRYIKISLYGLI